MTRETFATKECMDAIEKSLEANWAWQQLHKSQRQAILDAISASGVIAQLEEPPKQWRQLGPEHDQYIDKQSTRAFVK